MFISPRMVGTVAAYVCMFSCAACSRDEAVSLDRQELLDFAVGECPKHVSRMHEVAIEEIVKHPEKFEGRLVEVKGYYYGYFEHSAIYSTPEEKPYSHVFKDGIWVTGVPLNYAGEHVTLSGVFTQKLKGHLNQWAGTICADSIVEFTRTP